MQFDDDFVARQAALAEAGYPYVHPDLGVEVLGPVRVVRGVDSRKNREATRRVIAARAKAGPLNVSVYAMDRPFTVDEFRSVQMRVLDHLLWECDRRLESRASFVTQHFPFHNGVPPFGSSRVGPLGSAGPIAIANPPAGFKLARVRGVPQELLCNIRGIKFRLPRNDATMTITGAGDTPLKCAALVFMLGNTTPQARLRILTALRRDHLDMAVYRPADVNSNSLERRVEDRTLIVLPPSYGDIPTLERKRFNLGNYIAELLGRDANKVRVFAN